MLPSHSVLGTEAAGPCSGTRAAGGVILAPPRTIIIPAVGPAAGGSLRAAAAAVTVTVTVTAVEPRPGAPWSVGYDGIGYVTSIYIYIYVQDVF